MPPEGALPIDVVRAVLARGQSRLLVRDVLRGFAIAGVAMAVAFVLLPISLRTVVLLILAGGTVVPAVALMRRHTRKPGAVAQLIERTDPSLKNLVITSEELLRHPSRSAEWIADRVHRDSAARLQTVDLRSAIPVGRAMMAACGALLLAALMPLAARTFKEGGPAGVVAPVEGSNRGRFSVEIRVEPPAYSKRPPAILASPEHVDGLEGTKLIIVATASSQPVTIRFGERPLQVVQRASGFVAEVVLAESGYLAVESSGEPVRLISVAVTPDRAPIVKIAQPGRDLLLPDVRGAVEVGAIASDDLGLDRVALRYTKVSGTGEQFEFVEGELPLVVEKDTPRAWRARGRIPIATLGLEPGDSLVYRVTARDSRPGAAGEASSDTFFVEIAGPGQVPLEGFEMPPEQERYALSQQMIVVKLRRIRERERKLTPEALEEQTTALAAEQRAVRANFVFLMGGHVEDEEEEAEQSHEIQEGRLENTARREISLAVSHMTTAEQGLTARDTGAALAAAVKAVEALQRAFSRNRYILRTLPSRLRIDPSRRLSGALDEAKDGVRPAVTATDDPDLQLARQLLSGMLALIPQLRSQPGAPQTTAALSAAAERALSAGRADPQWTTVAQSILRLRASASEGGAPSQIDSDAGAVVHTLLQRVRRDAATVRASPTNRIESAWADEARRR